MIDDDDDGSSLCWHCDRNPDSINGLCQACADERNTHPLWLAIQRRTGAAARGGHQGPGGVCSHTGCAMMNRAAG